MLQEWPAALLQYCVHLTGSRVDAEDLTQETLLKAIPLLQGHTTHPHPEAYLKSIAKHTWIDWHRRAQSKHEWIVDQTRLQDAPPIDRVDRADVVDVGDVGDVTAALTVLLTRLTPLERTVLLLQDVYLWTAKETAFRLQSTEGAVKAALRRARTKLRPLNGLSPEQVADDDAQRDLLQTYLAAFRNHHIEGLIQLGQIDTLDPVVATSRIVRRGCLRADSVRAGDSAVARPRAAAGGWAGPDMRRLERDRGNGAAA